jgi:hypothetical protein
MCICWRWATHVIIGLSSAPVIRARGGVQEVAKKGQAQRRLGTLLNLLMIRTLPC